VAGNVVAACKAGRLEDAHTHCFVKASIACTTVASRWVARGWGTVNIKAACPACSCPKADCSCPACPACAPEKKAVWTTNPVSKVVAGTTGPADVNGAGKPLYVCQGAIPDKDGRPS
jgi:hypothetical protein